MTSEQVCNHGVRWVEGETFTSRRPDYSKACNRPATGHSTSGHPRCDEHRAYRYVVTVGTSLTLTNQVHDTAEQAKVEILARLGYATVIHASAPHYVRATYQSQLSRMTARPATAADIERFEAIASQTLESVTVAGSPR